MRGLITALLLLLALPAQADLKVFACEPEWAALVRELAPRAEVFIATTARQDPHRIEARPSLIARLRNADLAVCTGAELEQGWLPLLQRRANNPAVQPGRPGYFEAAAQVELLDRRERVSRSEGDVHAAGNPHLHLDPRNLIPVARALGERLAQVDQADAAGYRARTEDFLQRWQAAIGRWEQRAAPLKGQPVVVNHTNWRYLEVWLGLEPVAALEPRPGVPANAGHLAQVLETAQARQVSMALYAAYEDSRPARWLAERSSVQAVELPYTVGGNPEAADLFGLFESTLTRLLEARR